MIDFERKLFANLANHLKDKEFTIISGARQTGKTTLLNQLLKYLQDRQESVFYLTLEDPAILSRFNQHPENLFEFIIRTPEKRQFVLLDEVQYLNDPSNFLKLLYDKYSPDLKVIATGSSAFYIDRKFKDSLAGRKRLFELYTLDFDEYLKFRTGNENLQKELDQIRSTNKYISSKRKVLESHFNEYLTYGGYPAVVLAGTAEKKKEILKELMGSYLKRDIAESNIQDQEKFYRLLLMLSHQAGSMVNVNELSRTLKLSVTAVENYLYVLRKCFHVHLLTPFYGNIRKELTKMPKVYFHDLGFRNSIMNLFSPLTQRPDKGSLIENYAFIRLREKYGTDNLHYWRTADGNEIDFIVTETEGKGKAIEIKFDEEKFNPARYLKFITGYPGYSLTYRAFQSINNLNFIMAL
ncbi:MAG: ATP-binding protein [Bacteroidetes bacterium]|nr:ATP-binding protein [Bacteroidota bacterium]